MSRPPPDRVRDTPWPSDDHLRLGRGPRTPHVGPTKTQPTPSPPRRPREMPPPGLTVSMGIERAGKCKGRGLSLRKGPVRRANLTSRSTSKRRPLTFVVRRNRAAEPVATCGQSRCSMRGRAWRHAQAPGMRRARAVWARSQMSQVQESQKQVDLAIEEADGAG